MRNYGAVLLLMATAGPVRADALAKLQPDKLEAVHRAVATLHAQRQKLTRCGPYREYRANLHVHSALSHDSRGTLAESGK